MAQYWTPGGWLLNSDDNFTTLLTSAVALTSNGPTGVVPKNTSVTLANGQGTLTLKPPAANSARGTVDVALNLGAGATDQSCLAGHPASVGTNLAWLRSLNGSCAATYDRDPSARASFGLSTPESRATVHVREVFN
jgi:MSHA biogenesis protein MshQ